ncbi:hypothetical protein [Dickeya chrysanthemi]|uniref:hypothetical protein n=1 Tax=Dickeya chrysanthemi TaxID=556 RepID=UPI0003A325D6|nr:hypothetical protein [Dickeya chrysanthemi]
MMQQDRAGNGPAPRGDDSCSPTSAICPGWTIRYVIADFHLKLRAGHINTDYPI